MANLHKRECAMQSGFAVIPGFGRSVNCAGCQKNRSISALVFYFTGAAASDKIQIHLSRRCLASVSEGSKSGEKEICWLPISDTVVFWLRRIGCI